MLGGIGMPELMVILVIVLIVFGAGRLPDIGTGFGKAIQGFKKASEESMYLLENRPQEDISAPRKDSTN